MKLKLISDLDKQPYLLRWTLFNIKGYSLKLHVFLKSDEDRALHSHPWIKFYTFILYGGYWEHTAEGKFWRSPGYFGSGNGDYLHRVELAKYEQDTEDNVAGENKLAVTLFFTYPKTKSWGFACPQGMKEHTDFHRDNGCGD